MIKKVKFFIYFKKPLFSKNEAGNISSAFRDSKDIIFILPSSPEDLTAGLLLPEYFKKHGRKIRVVCTNNAYTMLPEGFFDETIILELKELGLLTTPPRHVKNLLLHLHTDIVFDLSRSEHLFYKYAARTVHASYYIGSQKDEAELFYDFVFKSGEVSSEEYYKNFLTCIKMFLIGK